MQDYSFTELSPEDFEAFVFTQKCNNFLQSREMFNRYQANNREAYLVGVVKDHQTIAAALVMKLQSIKGRKVFSTPGGPILDYEAKDSSKVLRYFFKELSTFLKAHSGSVLQVSPNVLYSEELTKTLESLSFKNLGEYIQAKWITARGFEGIKSEDELLAELRTTHRQNVRKTINRYKLEIRELKKDELGILFNEVNKAAAKHDFVAQDQSYYEEMFDAFGDKIKVLAAYYEGKPICAAMFVIYGNEVVYLYSGSDPEYSKIYGPYALQWHMLCYCLKNHIPRYNFFGTYPVEENGVYQFKLGFRGKLEELQGTFMLPLDILGKLYVARKKYHKYGELS